MAEGSPTYTVQGRQLSGWLRGKQQAPLKLTGYSYQLRSTLAALPTLKQGVIAGYSGRKMRPPGGLPTRRSCNLQSFFPMNCLWRTGMFYQLFGRRSPWWGWSSSQVSESRSTSDVQYNEKPCVPTCWGPRVHHPTGAIQALQLPGMNKCLTTHCNPLQVQ